MCCSVLHCVAHDLTYFHVGHEAFIWDMNPTLCVYVCVYVCVYMCVYVCVYVRVYDAFFCVMTPTDRMCVYICVYMYIYCTHLYL